ncbi:MAG: hypothetical protein Fur007_15500 [Rhodoferax sp.]
MRAMASDTHPPPAPRHAAWLGPLLVALQFGLLALLGGAAWRALPADGGRWRAALGLLLASALVGVWTLAHNRPGNFNIRPQPRSGGRLVTGGPYAWVRHPMYSAVLLLAAGLAVAIGRGWTVWAWLALGVVLLAKARIEERWMSAQHPNYAAHFAGIRRFIPGVF